MAVELVSEEAQHPASQGANTNDNAGGQPGDSSLGSEFQHASGGATNTPNPGPNGRRGGGFDPFLLFFLHYY